MTRYNLLAALALLPLVACSSKKTEKKEAPAPVAETPSTAGQGAPTGMPPGPYKIERTQLQTLARTSAQGETHQWQALAGIEVSEESIQQLYVSRGSYFVAFKAQVKGGKEDCLLRYKTELIEGPTGRGNSVATITGSQALPAGETLTVSGIAALSSEDAAKVQSASAGYWTLCGAEMPSPSELDLKILKTDTEEVELGNAFKIHLSVIDIERPAKPESKPTRCHFHVVAEDIDKDGYTLNRDFASYSLAPNSKGQVKLRRTAFEGGSELDFVKAVAGKRYYLNELSCEPAWDAKSAKVEGIGIEEIALHRVAPVAGSAEQLERASFDYSAKLKNRTGKDCAFRIRYRILDEAGFPLHKSPVLSEVLHLRKGAQVSYRSDKHRLYTWLDQADAATSLVVQEAGPLRECMLFDPEQALAD